MNKNRVENFSDCIFTIIMTLLVLEMKVPYISNETSNAELCRALVSLIPKFISMVISFLTICIIWVNHHELFRAFKHVDKKLFWLNANLLLWVCVIPFPTAIMGDYPHNKLAALLYGIVLAICSISFNLMRVYSLANKHLIIKETIDISSFIRGTKKSIVFGELLYIVGGISSFVSTTISFIIYAIIILYFLTIANLKNYF